ncbi:MAG: HI0074 family nucleotidyltransferase substrate-binding subunit [Candidatus Omnitrophota bacterium]
MKEELKYSLEKLENALIRLKQGAREAEDELREDGVIQRFEFTFELFWKTLKIFLQYKGIEARTPRDVFKEAFKLEWLADEKLFLDMLEDRNKTSHVYEKETSREIFKRIRDNYILMVEAVLEKMKSKDPEFSA